MKDEMASRPATLRRDEEQRVVVKAVDLSDMSGIYFSWKTKGGSINVPLTSCLTGL